MNNRKKIHISDSSARISGFSKYAFYVLAIGLFVILIYLFGFLFMLLSNPDVSGKILAIKYFDTLEHIIMSLALVVCGALGIDLFERSLKK